jgi:predicted kinase
MVGLPRSGKSTKSKELGFPIVESDAIRKALGTYPFDEAQEYLTGDYMDTMVKALFYAGHNNVILDSTNITKKERDSWLSDKYHCQYYFIDTEKDVCIARAKELNQDYLIPVIIKMSSKKDW